LSTLLPLRMICAVALVNGICLALPAQAQFSFPSNPTNESQCEPGAQQWRAQYQQEHERGSQLHTESNRIQTPPGCFGNDSCRAAYYAQKAEYHRRVMHHYAQRDRIKAAGDPAERACRATARVNARNAEEQRRVAAENQRRMQQQAENAQRQREQAETRHREQLAEYERGRQAAERHDREQQRRIAEEQRNRAQYDANQRQAHAAQLEQQRRQHEREQARQARVIAETQPGPFDPATRNTPRVVQTPELRAQQAEEQRQAAERQRQEEARALRGTVSSVRESLSTTHRDTTTVATNAAAMSELNTVVTMGRGGSAVAAGIGSSSIAASGARGADALYELNTALNNVQSTGPSTGSGAGNPGASGSAASPPAPKPSVLAGWIQSDEALMQRFKRMRAEDIFSTAEALRGNEETARARIAYQALLTQYPDHALAPRSATALQELR